MTDPRFGRKGGLLFKLAGGGGRGGKSEESGGGWYTLGGMRGVRLLDKSTGWVGSLEVAGFGGAGTVEAAEAGGVGR